MTSADREVAVPCIDCKYLQSNRMKMHVTNTATEADLSGFCCSPPALTQVHKSSVQRLSNRVKEKVTPAQFLGKAFNRKLILVAMNSWKAM